MSMGGDKVRIRGTFRSDQPAPPEPVHQVFVPWSSQAREAGPGVEPPDDPGATRSGATLENEQTPAPARSRPDRVPALTIALPTKIPVLRIFMIILQSVWDQSPRSPNFGNACRPSIEGNPCDSEREIPVRRRRGDSSVQMDPWRLRRAGEARLRNLRRRGGRGWESRHSSPVFPLSRHGPAESSPMAGNADRAVLYDFRRFPAGIQT